MLLYSGITGPTFRGICTLHFLRVVSNRGVCYSSDKVGCVCFNALSCSLERTGFMAMGLLGWVWVSISPSLLTGLFTLALLHCLTYCILLLLCLSISSPICYVLFSDIAKHG